MDTTLVLISGTWRVLHNYPYRMLLFSNYLTPQKHYVHRKTLGEQAFGSLLNSHVVYYASKMTLGKPLFNVSWMGSAIAFFLGSFSASSRKNTVMRSGPLQSGWTFRIFIFFIFFCSGESEREGVCGEFRGGAKFFLALLPC